MTMFQPSAYRNALVLCILLVPCGRSFSEDWPRWRGVRGDGTWNAPKLPDQWPKTGLKRAWTMGMGGGYCGITVADGRVFTMDLEAPVAPKKSADEADAVERVLCLSAGDGKLLWFRKQPVHYGGLGGYNNGPRAAPTFHDGKVYTLGAVGHFHCFDAASGDVLWKHDMVKDFKARIPEWGFAASPVIDGDKVIVHTGAEPDGCYIAFHRNTGKEIWRGGTDPAGYGTPIVIDAPGGKQVVGWNPEHAVGLDAATGKVLWKVPYKVTYGVSIATPIYRDGIVMVTGYWEGSKAIRLGPKPGDHELIWEDKRNLRGIMAQPLYRDGLVYSIDRQAGLTCFELKTGKKLWDDENKMTPAGRNPHASFVWINDGDRILSLNSIGELILARINANGYKEQSRTKIIDGKVWGHPAFADKYIFLRTDGAEGQGKGPFDISCVQLVE